MQETLDILGDQEAVADLRQRSLRDRAGKPLDEPFDGYHFARRGTHRIIYRIDEAKHQVEIHSIRHRRDAYRAGAERSMMGGLGD
jgi:mRNA-degrading endonuclease RelE of RelBE toxin-antitoxin system